MKFDKKEKFRFLVLIVVSFLLANHYQFRLIQSIVLTVLIIISVMLVNFVLRNTEKYKLTTFNPRIVLFIAFLVLVYYVPRYEGARECHGCDYPPIVLVDGSSVDFLVTSEPEYIDSTEFTGYITNGERYIDLYDIITEEVERILYDQGSFYDVEYVNGYVYVSGYKLSDPEVDGDNFSVQRYNLETGETEVLLESRGLINLSAFNEHIYIYLQNELNPRLLTYNEDFELESSVPYPGGYDLVQQTENFEGVEIVQRLSGIYFYQDGRLIKKVMDSSYLQHIGYHEGLFYITSSTYNEAGTYDTHVFDREGEKVDVIEDYPLQWSGNYIKFAENYIIVNDTYDTDRGLVISGTSDVMDYSGKVVKDGNRLNIKIYDLRDGLYGSYSGRLYELREVEYTSLIQYDDPQHGFFFWVLMSAAGYFMFRRKQFIVPDTLKKALKQHEKEMNEI